MKNNNYKGINFFEPKIDINLDDNKSFIKGNLLKNSIKIYILVFCITMVYFAFNTIKINIKYNSMQKKITKAEQVDSTSNNLKYAINEEKVLTEIFNNYLQSNKVSSDIINQIENTKFEQIDIGEIDWVLNEIKLVCYGQSEKDAITFVNKLRQNEKFKNILYTGGSASSLDSKFKFEINIIL
ncbi:hypothetical protein [uncultured Tyzzerella sp.]|uniref:hypothetical protein n=1 Tax=uncultured Tyzzerella sp. TaxID=2321398 RepID=UPI002941D078|nr:hypothetical protein [uncultured Tyzzerella sp.]